MNAEIAALLLTNGPLEGWRGGGWGFLGSQRANPLEEFFFPGKFASYFLAIKLIENDAALFYHRGRTLNLTFTIQVSSYDTQY